MKTIFNLEIEGKERLLDIYTKEDGRVQQQDVIRFESGETLEDIIILSEIYIENYTDEYNIPKEEVEKIGFDKLAIEIFQKNLGELPEGYDVRVYDGHYPGDEFHILFNPEGKEISNFYIDY